MVQSNAILLATTAAEEGDLMDFTYKLKLSDMFIAMVGR